MEYFKPFSKKCYATTYILLFKIGYGVEHYLFEYKDYVTEISLYNYKYYEF